MCLLKHDEYLEELYQQLKDHYHTIYRGLPLHSQRGRLVGEIDMVAVGNHGVDIFEVKCSYRPVKAKKQLEKIKRIFGGRQDQPINAWFYCGEAAKLVKIS